MADKKISALTAASTPLAGTEVLPIVQSGSTVKVAISDVTAGRSVAMKDLTVTNTGFQLADLTRTGISGLVIGADSGGALLAPKTVDKIQFYNAAITTQVYVFDTGTGNITNQTGNYVVGTSGKGIDFSVTPGTGTSELLADYEEGTFSPTYEPQTGAFGSITYGTQSGKYTKVGNAVHVAIGIRTTAITVGTASGFVAIGGLPFTSASTPSYMPLAVGSALNFGANTPSACFTDNPGTKAWLAYRTAANGGTTFLGVTDLNTGASNNYIFVCGTYFV